MALGEIYLKLAVAFPNDPKVRGLARFGAPDAGLARDLYVQMCLHCKEHLTDGHVSAEQVGLLVYPLDPEHGNQLAKQLASVELIKEEASGWQVLAYVRRNGTREDVEKLSKVRAEAGRTGGRKSRKRPAQSASQAKRKQVANQAAEQNGSNAVSVSVKTTETETQTPTESAAMSKRKVADALTDAFWERHKSVTAQSYVTIRGIVRTAIANGLPRDDVARALDRLAHEHRAISGGSITTALQQIHGTQQANGAMRGGARQELLTAEQVADLDPGSIV